jgi:hypothetical protein
MRVTRLTKTEHEYRLTLTHNEAELLQGILGRVIAPMTDNNPYEKLAYELYYSLRDVCVTKTHHLTDTLNVDKTDYPPI